MLRFSLKHTLLGVLSLAVLFWFVPRVYYHWKVRPVVGQLEAWLASQEDEQPPFRSCCIVQFAGDSFYVSRSEQVYDSENNQWIYSESTSKDGALFVAPPGQWCLSIDEAARCIYRTHRRGPNRENFTAALPLPN